MDNKTMMKHYKKYRKTLWFIALLLTTSVGLSSDIWAQNSAIVRSGAGSSSLTVQQLGQQADNLRARNTAQQADIDANEAEMQSIEDDTATQQTRINNLNTTLTAPQPTGSDLDDRSDDARIEAQDIESHARNPIPNPGCASGQKLFWNGTAWNCVTELDNTVGVHATTAKVPPACALDEKTIWDVPTSTWSCAAELTQTGAAGPQGPDGPAGADGIDGGGIWQYGTGGKIYYNAGLVGVGGAHEAGMALRVTGNATIDGNLDVGGNTKPGTTGTCSAGIEGAMRYNSGNGEVEVCVEGLWQGVSVDGSGLCVPPGSCLSPWATWVTNGGSITAYQSNSVPYGSSCNSQTRTCSSGTLSGSYTFSNCTVQAPANCSLPWGGSIGHGSNVTAYQSSSVSCLNSCNGQTRTCNNGTLSGSYSNQSCTVNACNNCSRPWGGTVAHGGSITAYASASPACGSGCTSQTRTCSDGSLSGSYTNQSCTTRCCLPWGGSINSGSSTTAYQSSSVACGNSCVSQTRTCSGTSLSGSYTNSSCSVAGCASCARPWGGTVAHGNSITAYASASPSCGTNCSSQTRTCNNGSLSGSYTNQSCTTRCCLPWGGSITSGSSRTAYQTSSVACGNTCNSQTRTCSGTTLSGSYTNQSCSVASCGCSLPWGGTISSGSSVTAYQSSSVPCGSSCNSQTRTCSGTSLSGSYTNSSCSVGACANCSYGVNHGQCVRRYLVSTSDNCGGLCATCNMMSTNFCCNNGTLSYESDWPAHPYTGCIDTCSGGGFDCF